MLQTKFHGNRPTGSGEEGFRRVVTIYGRGGHVTRIMSSTFSFSCTESFHTKFDSDLYSSF